MISHIIRHYNFLELEAHPKFKKDFLQALIAEETIVTSNNYSLEEAIRNVCKKLLRVDLTTTNRKHLFTFRYGFIPLQCIYYTAIQLFFKLFEFQKRTEYVLKPSTCPNCSYHIADILYGHPCLSNRLTEDVTEGKIVIEHEEMKATSPQWMCPNCGKKIYKADYSPLRYYYGQECCPDDKYSQLFWKYEKNIYPGLSEYEPEDRADILLGALAERFFDRNNPSIADDYFNHASCAKAEKYGLKRPTDFNAYKAYYYRKRAYLLASPFRRMTLPPFYRKYVFKKMSVYLQAQLSATTFIKMNYICDEINTAVKQGNIKFFLDEKSRIENLPQTEEYIYAPYLYRGKVKMEKKVSNIDFYHFYENIEKEYYKTLKTIIG